jgi:hypothetical protein
MKTFFLSFFVIINMNAQNEIFLKIKEVQTYESNIKIQAKDIYTQALNKKINRLDKNLFFVPIKEESKYWLYLLLDKTEVNNSMKKNIVNKCQIYIYDLESKLLISLNYDDSDHLIIEKKGRKYYFGFHTNYDDIDSITIFNDDFTPLFSLKYTGSFVLLNTPTSHKPFCVYNHKLNNFYFFEMMDDLFDNKFKNMDVGNLFNILKTYPFDKDTGNKALNVKFKNTLLNKVKNL